MARLTRKAWSFTFALRPQREAEFTPKGRGGGRQKVFDDIHDYSFNKKWFNLRTSGSPKGWGGLPQGFRPYS